MPKAAFRVLAISLLGLGCAPLSAASQAEWRSVFQATSPNASLVCALAEGPEWTVGGADVIVSNRRGAVDEFRVNGVMIEAFGQAADGSTYAVGSHGTILKRVDVHTWKLEHQSRPPGSKGKVRDEDILVGVRAVLMDSTWTTVAYGPGSVGSSLVLVRRESGSWERPSDPAVLQRVLAAIKTTPPVQLPKTCMPATQLLWFDARNGMVLCHDLRAFAWLDSAMVQLGRMPKVCDILNDVARRDSEVFASCGERGQVWRFAAGSWAKVPGVVDVRKLSANSKCIVAVTERSVRQQCTN